MTYRDLIDQSNDKMRPLRWLSAIVWIGAIGGLLSLSQFDGNYSFAVLLIMLAALSLSSWLEQFTCNKISCAACGGSLGRCMARDNGLVSLRLPLDLFFCPRCGIKLDDEATNTSTKPNNSGDAIR